MAMATTGGPARMPGGPDWMRVKGRAELRSDEEGFSGAWFEVEITRLFPSTKQAYVCYIEFVEPDSDVRVTEFVKMDNLRPVPPALPKRKWKERDAVETRYDDAWWTGYIKGLSDKPGEYWCYYGKDVNDQEIHVDNIRLRQNYVRPSRDCPNGAWCIARPMQNPAIWERIEETPAKKTPGKKTPATTTPVAKTPGRKTPVAQTTGKKRLVSQIQPRVSVPAPHVGDESDDSWDAREERRQKKKPRVQSKSVPAKSEVKQVRIKFVAKPKKLTITHALPAINPPAKLAEQSTLVLTPGSSPPLAESPFQDSAISPGSDSQAQKPLANSEASLPTKSKSSSSSSSGSGGSGSSNSSSSGDDDDDCAQSGDGDHSVDEDVSIDGRMSNGIFPDFSNDGRTSQHKQVYKQLLECFKHDSKGMLDQQRHNILTAIREELKLSTDDVNHAHCAVFGLPLAITVV